MKLKFNKHTIVAIGLIAATICCFLFKDTLINSFAANNNYYGGYNDVTSIELDNNYSATQGFHIHKNEAYFVKITKHKIIIVNIKIISIICCGI